MPRDIRGAGEFPGQIEAGSGTELNADTVGIALRAMGMDPARTGVHMSSQMGAIAGQIEKTLNDRVRELREVQRAQSSGLEVAGLKDRFDTLTSEISAMKSLITDVLSRGLPSTYRDPDSGRFTSNPNAMRQLTRAAVTAQGALPGTAAAFSDDDLISDSELPSPYLERLSQIRTQTRMGRVISREMEGGIDDDFRSELTRHREELLEAIPEKVAEFHAAMGRGDTDAARMSQIESTQASNLAKEIQNVLEYNAQSQGNSLNRVMSHVGKIVATIGAAGIASRVFLQEPYQFETRPALGVLSQQGEIGSMLGGAFGEVEQYRLGINQQALYTGAAMIGTGFAMGGLGGAAVGTIGAIAGASGLLGGAADVYFGIPGTTDEDQILSQSLVQAVANPERLVSNFMTARPGLFAAMDDEEQFGYALGEGSRGDSDTGNVILDRMLELRGLGFNQEQMGALLSQTAMTLRGGPEEMTGMATDAGRIGSAYGIDEGAVLANMQTAQRYGSENARESLLMAMGAAADSEGNITSYTTNVLVPALMKVTESMAIQNLARSSDDLEKEVYGLRRTLVDSGTNLGQLVEQNPEMIARVVNTIQGAVGAAMDNPAMLAYDLAMGSSYAEVALRKPIVMQRRLQNLLDSPHLSGIDFSDPEQVFSSEAQTALRYAQSISNVGDDQMLMQLLSIVQGGRSLVGFDGDLTDEARDIMQGTASEDINERLNEILGADLGELAASMATQTDEALKTSQTLVDAMIELQEKISEFVMSDKIVDYAKAGIDRVVARIEQFLEGEERPLAPDTTAQDAMRELREHGGRDVADNLISAMGGEGNQSTMFVLEQLNNMSPDELQSFAGEWRETFPDGFSMNAANLDLAEEYLDERFGVTESGYRFGYATGGYTGIGGTHDVAGAVHAGEYVISQQNVNENRALLDRIQSGEKVERLSTTKTGSSTYVTMRIHGMDPETIYKKAEEAASNYIVRNRLQYT